MKKIMLIVLIVVIFVVLFALKTLNDAGEFKTINPHTDFNCSKIGTIPGPEDIVIDYTTGIAYISSDDRRAYNRGENINGSVFSYDIKKKALKKLKSNFPFEFHPHGIDFISVSTDKKLLYVVNHRTDGHFIEKFLIKGDSIEYVKSFEDQHLMFSPNDIVIISEDMFYVTNDHGNRSSFGKTIEDYLQLANSYVLFFNGKDFSIKAKGIKYANGITMSLDKSKLFVASPVGRCIHAYTIDKNYDLTHLYSIQCNTGVDNIAFDKDGTLWAGCHPKLLTFVKHAQNEQVLAPSEILTIRFDGDAYTIKTVFLDDGKLIQSSTVAVRYNSTVLIGSVFDTHILACLEN